MPLMPDRSLPPSITDALGDLHFGMRDGSRIVPCQVTREYLATITGPGAGSPLALDALAERVRDLITVAASHRFDTAGTDRRGIVVLSTSQMWLRAARLRQDRPAPATNLLPIALRCPDAPAIRRQPGPARRTTPPE